MPIPLLILSDAVTSKSGLGRITRELATRIARLAPEFKVATLGYGGAGTVNLPFPQYHAEPIKDWIVKELPLAWHDFAGSERGIVLVIWDASRLDWLVNPPDDLLFADWLRQRPFDLWTYTTMDAEGPNGKLTGSLQHTLKGFDRVLNYTSWASGVTGYPDHLPHGIDTSIFCPQPNGKEKFRSYGFKTLKDDDLLIGIIATNQTRKDWPLGIQTIVELRRRGYPVKLWGHTDVLRRHWNIEALLTDYEIPESDAVITVAQFADSQLAELYSACDVTLGIGSEGFGLPLAESLACGTPVVHGNYAGGATFVPPAMLVEPIAYHYETPYCWKRPVFTPESWADKVEQVHGNYDSILPEYLDWNNLWPKWHQWLKDGIK